MMWCRRALAFALILSVMTQVSIHLPIPSQEFSDFNLFGHVDALFEEGDGTESNPYQISNITQLQDIRKDLNANYSIINHINASETLNWNDGKGFEPIGDYNNSFSGTLDGGGYNISSLYIYRKDLTRVGLIGYSKDAILSNISLFDVEIYAGNRVGALVGSAEDTEISNCSSSGEVETNANATGGLVGICSGNISHCSSICTVRGGLMSTGGLVGTNLGLIQNCHSASEVYGILVVGGLVGGNAGSIQDSDSINEVSGRRSVGGLVGENHGFIWDCHSSSNIKEEALQVGGLVGTNVGEITNCFATGVANGLYSVGGLVGFHFSGSINDCYSEGNVEGEDNIGGLVGWTNGVVLNCFSTGDVRGYNSIGGFVGYINTSGNVSKCYAKGDVNCQVGGGFAGQILGDCSNCCSLGDVICNHKIAEFIYLGGFTMVAYGGKVERCYSTGKILYKGGIEEGTSIGGFCSYPVDNIQDCFWDYESSGIDTSEGGTPKNTSEMMKKETFTDANWDFDDTWAIHEGSSYPFFQDQYHSPIILSEVPDALEDQFYSYQLNSSLSYIPGIENTPEYFMTTNTNAHWLSITPDGLLKGIPTNDDVGTWWARITVVDQARNVDQKNFTFEVVNTNDDPIILTGSLPNATEDMDYKVKIEAMDIDPTEDILTWEIVEKEATFLTLDNSTGILSGKPVESDIGSYTLEISLTDGNGGMNSALYELIVLDVNDPPIIISDDLISVLQNELYNVTYRVFDEDDPDDFEWYLHTNANWLSMINDTGRLSGIPGNDDIGHFFVNITVEDIRGGRTNHNFSLEVVDVNDPPIWINVSEDVEVQRGELFTFEFEAEDIDDPELFEWSLNTNAEWLRLISGTGKMTGIPKDDDVGSFFANISVEDVRGGWSTYNFTLTVKNENDPPVWTNIPVDEAIEERFQYTFDVDAFDMDEDTLIYGISSNPETGITIDENTGVITWTATLEQFTPPLNVLYVSLNVSDGYHVMYRNFTISVIKNSTVQPVNSDSNSTAGDENSSVDPALILMSVLLIVIIVVAILLVVLVRKKYRRSAQVPLSTGKPVEIAPETGSKIFISYAKNNSETAFKICDILESSGFKCWIAPRDILPGETWGKAIISGINSCRLMIMVFSEDSNQSVQVLREIERAVHKKIPIIIFRISDIEPSEEFEYYVSAVHWLDAVSEPVDQHMENLRDVVIRSFKVRTDDKKVLDQKIQKELKPPETSEVEALPPIRDEVEY